MYYRLAQDEMIDLDSSVLTPKRLGESSTSTSTQTDASELLSTSDASNEQKFLTSSSCPKFTVFTSIQKVGGESTAERRNISSGGNKGDMLP